MKKPKNKSLKKTAKPAKKPINLPLSKKKETASQVKNPSLPLSPIQLEKNLKKMSSPLPLMKAENTFPLDLPKNNMDTLPRKYKNNISPEVAAELDKIVSEMVSKIKPEMQQITLFLKQHGIPGTSIELMMGAINPASNPAPAPSNDLVDGITQILNHEFGENKQEILGMIYNKNNNVAFEIAKILEAARKRDQMSLVKELEIIIKKLQ